MEGNPFIVLPATKYCWTAADWLPAHCESSLLGVVSSRCGLAEFSLLCRAGTHTEPSVFPADRKASSWTWCTLCVGLLLILLLNECPALLCWGGKPGFWLLHLCVWSIAVNPAGVRGYGEEIPQLLSCFFPTGVWKRYIYILCSTEGFVSIFSASVSENIKEELQNAEISFSALTSLLRFLLAFYKGLTVCARMELKYRSCVLIYLLSCMFILDRKRHCQLIFN